MIAATRDGAQKTSARGGTAGSGPEPRQRWRIVFSREPVPADQVGRAALEAWQSSLDASGLPVARLGDASDHPRVALAAPLPAAARGEGELVEVWLLERHPLWSIREALAPVLPAAHGWVGAEDVWVGAPPLAGRLVAADWRVELRQSAADDVARRLAAAAGAMLAARSIRRVRVKGTTERAYDLRPLVTDVRIVVGGTVEGATLGLALRTRFDPELGAGRPDDVVAALAEMSDVDLEVVALTRTRLLLAEDLQ